MRFVGLVLGSMFTAACGISTSTGKLDTATDQSLQCDDRAESPLFACTVHLALAGDRLDAVGVFHDGSAGGPTASATLTPAASAELAGLIASFPLETDDTIHSDGCGGPPMRTTTWTIEFDNGEHRAFAYEYSSDATVVAVNSFVLDLVNEVTTCHGDKLAFAGCTPYLQAQGAGMARAQVPSIAR